MFYGFTPKTKTYAWGNFLFLDQLKTERGGYFINVLQQLNIAEALGSVTQKSNMKKLSSKMCVCKSLWSCITQFFFCVQYQSMAAVLGNWTKCIQCIGNKPVDGYSWLLIGEGRTFIYKYLLDPIQEAGNFYWKSYTEKNRGGDSICSHFRTTSISSPKASQTVLPSHLRKLCCLPQSLRKTSISRHHPPPPSFPSNWALCTVPLGQILEQQAKQTHQPAIQKLNNRW